MSYKKSLLIIKESKDLILWFIMIMGVSLISIIWSTEWFKNKVLWLNVNQTDNNVWVAISFIDIFPYLLFSFLIVFFFFNYLNISSDKYSTKSWVKDKDISQNKNKKIIFNEIDNGYLNSINLFNTQIIENLKNKNINLFIWLLFSFVALVLLVKWIYEKKTFTLWMEFFTYYFPKSTAIILLEALSFFFFHLYQKNILENRLLTLEIKKVKNERILFLKEIFNSSDK